MNLWVNNWEDMPIKKRHNNENLIHKKTKKFYFLVKNRYKLFPNLKVMMLRLVFKKLINSYKDTEPDKIYWKSKGWI
jgi:hypothetical protein